jgi:glycosyltransferase involved in cell wall biosynthesis
MSNETGISILIRTSNSEKPLRDLLNRLQRSSQDEIILVDTGSKDRTVALAEQAGARVIRNDGPFNYSRTLNFGFQAARNGQVLVLSVHCLPVNSDFLERYRQALLRLPEAWAVVYGMEVYSKKQYDRNDKTFEVCAGTEVLARLRGGGNANALYSKRAWEMHRFDESLKTGEDLEWLNWAARTELVSAKAMEACVFYRHPGGPIYRFKKACDEVWILGDNCRPVSVLHLAIGVAHASRHLLWEEFSPRPWIGQVSHVLGAFVASRKLLRPR